MLALLLQELREQRIVCCRSDCKMERQVCFTNRSVFVDAAQNRRMTIENQFLLSRGSAQCRKPCRLDLQGRANL